MRLDELTFRPNQHTKAMSDAERHMWLKFIAQWLAGSYMFAPRKSMSQMRDPAVMWQQIATMFPPKVPPQVRLYRLITVPIKYARMQHFSIKPAEGSVSSWSGTLVGIDAVAGVATDMRHNYGGYKDRTETARVAIEATIPGASVLATPISIRNAFMTLSHDYFERYPEAVTRTPGDNGRILSTVSYPGYPGGDDQQFTMDDVGFYQDVLNRPGGAYRQYEYVVRTPPRVDATLVQVYRIGNDEIRAGNDDPHIEPGQRPPPVRRLKKLPR
jgi:hypothetical protein